MGINDILENRVNITGETLSCDEAIIQTNIKSDLDLQITQMIEKGGEGVWKCKVCGKTANSSNIRHHAEVHIEGQSHACHLCSKTFTNRQSLRVHIINMHSELFSCDLCGKTGMNKMSYYNHKLRQHKASSAKYC